MLGILLALSIGLVMLHDTPALPGQATPSDIEIAITETGFVPNPVLVHPGQSITWKNESTIPHILSSEGLLTPSDESLQTSPIFPEAQATITVSPTMALGEYTYISQTSTLSGVVIVDDVSLPSASRPAVQQPATPQPTAPGTGTTPPTVTPASSTPPSTAPAASLLPQNPHTVGSIVPGMPSPSNPGTPSPLQQGYKPYRTPETGPALWGIALLSLSALLIVTRRHFQRTRKEDGA